MNLKALSLYLLKALYFGLVAGPGVIIFTCFLLTLIFLENPTVVASNAIHDWADTHVRNAPAGEVRYFVCVDVPGATKSIKKEPCQRMDSSSMSMSKSVADMAGGFGQIYVFLVTLSLIALGIHKAFAREPAAPPAFAQRGQS